MKCPAWILGTVLICCIVPTLHAESAAPATSMPLNLKTEQGSDFFTFFHLTETGAPVAGAASEAWHSFRPSGPAFHDLVELDVLAKPDGTIDAVSLGMDRSFIDDPTNGIFARDLAKSFLAWVDRTPSPQLNGLIANLADLSASGGRILMRGPAPPPPPADATGGYDAYLGRAPRAAFSDGAISFTFANFPGALPPAAIFQAGQEPTKPGPGWFRLDVRFGP
jgi:hypothetical protein